MGCSLQLSKMTWDKSRNKINATALLAFFLMFVKRLHMSYNPIFTHYSCDYTLGKFEIKCSCTVEFISVSPDLKSLTL